MANPAFGREVPWTKRSLCRHCDREIRHEGKVWRHVGTGFALCAPPSPSYLRHEARTYAEPTVEQLELDE